MNNSEAQHSDFRTAIAYLRAILAGGQARTAGMLIDQFTSDRGMVAAMTTVIALLAQEIPDVDGKLARIAEHAAREDGKDWPTDG